MIREFRNLDGQLLTQCECFVDVPYCAALDDMQYSVNYNRNIDTETITFKEPIDAEKLQNHIKFLKSDLNVELDALCRPIKDNRCGPNVQHPVYRYTNMFFHKKNGTYPSLYNRKCSISMLNGTDNEMQGCAILAELDKNNIQYTLYKPKHYKPLQVVRVYINNQPADKFWCIDNFYMLGICAGCKWHQPWKTGKYLFNRSIMNMCPVDRDRCHAMKLLSAGYTPYEAHVRCLVCEHIARLKLQNQK